MTGKRVETSKFLSYVLRHKPDSIDLALDREGWAEIDALIAAAARHGRALDRALIDEVVNTSEKKRFTLSDDGHRIRAAQGHSTDSVRITRVERVPPALLYHGTATRFLESIRTQGLLRGNRHHVHLSADVETATAVGRRHGAPVVLRIEAGRMHAAGHRFFLSDNAVWLVEHVPAEFFVVAD